MDEFASIARCHGATVDAVRATEIDEDTFRSDLVASVASSRAPYMVASFSRAPLGQTGDGHFSPIAGCGPSVKHAPAPCFWVVGAP